ncbi:hypothetical protein AMS58_07750 [Pseudoalteromonas porphyrae]|uniref:Uncharacterized protein n=2 Tax=Pseudoalteromonas TaxID=53246 RepID=A0A0N1MUQ6_9GAMM|nr:MULTISPECIES: hypothetical protein [Pseudoalteromonas]KPH65172.1 hypothetical protein ADS77_02570 [Pseudoalteromonas porphyrae]KPH95239.1 hypothetical protein AMS58_07750 [Pseudoalteromonas porphyrae]NMR26786.1 hypothetical protein [Pseudoalteromonas sp. NEC-BIFX-2020_015]NNG44120.1 hypothetical protein [Pseudoalteromonas sp. NEC-BIFX-2020_002]
MLKQLVLVSSLFTLAACNDSEPKQSAATEKGPLTSLEQYDLQAKTLLANIRAKKDAASLEVESADLVTVSQVLLSEFTVKYPQCTEYLNALNAAAKLIPTLPIEEIETGYHADGKLPKFDDPVCYHAKDLLVHPATVQAIARLGFVDEQAFQDAELEIVEVIAHFDQVQKALNK